MDERITQIKVLKNEKGYKNAEIAAALDVHFNTIGNALMNKSKPYMVGKILQFLTVATPTYKLTESEKQKYIQDYCETIKN